MEGRQKRGLIEKCQHLTDGEELKPYPKWWQYPPEEILVSPKFRSEPQAVYGPTFVYRLSLPKPNVPGAKNSQCLSPVHKIQTRRSIG
jgi:hypothetical protein